MLDSRKLKKIQRKNPGLALVDAIFWEKELEFPTHYIYYSYETKERVLAHLIFIFILKGNEIEVGTVNKVKNEEVNVLSTEILSYLKELILDLEGNQDKTFVEIDTARIESYISQNKRYEKYKRKKETTEEEEEREKSE